jgi:hypothetical protein
VCFETQISDELPQEDHDARMHWVVTEATVYPFVPDPPVIVPVALPAAVGVEGEIAPTPTAVAPDEPVAAAAEEPKDTP